MQTLTITLHQNSLSQLEKINSSQDLMDLLHMLISILEKEALEKAMISLTMMTSLDFQLVKINYSKNKKKNLSQKLKKQFMQAKHQKMLQRLTKLVLRVQIIYKNMDMDFG